MKKGLITSLFATLVLGFLAFFANAPKKNVKSKAKTYKNKFADMQEDQKNMFI